jgi:hypothetical protein
LQSVHETGDINDRPTVHSFADQSSLIAAGDFEQQRFALDANELDRYCHRHAYRRGADVMDVHFGSYGVLTG